MDLLAAQRRPSTPSAGELHSQFARLHLPFVGRPYRAVPLPRPSRGALEAHWRRAAEALSLREDLAGVYRRSFGEPCGGLSMAQLMQRVLPVLSGIAAAREDPLEVAGATARARTRRGARPSSSRAAAPPPRPTPRRAAAHYSPRAARRRRGCPPSTARRPRDDVDACLKALRSSSVVSVVEPPGPKFPSLAAPPPPTFGSFAAPPPPKRVTSLEAVTDENLDASHLFV
ncbi:hypothetical protein JL722_14292 [Aureococcus anophagefferens]|nr:hypothetical protein JL722_14292 [Aureococcus anophagefferens]